VEIREAFIGDVDQGFEEAQGLLAAGDVPGLLRCLRTDGDSLSLGALTVLVVEVGRLTGCADLALAATAVAESGDGSGAEDAKALYDFGGFQRRYYVLTGGVPAGLSPHGFHTGMTGRWGFLADSDRERAFALQRLRLVLDAAQGPQRRE